MKLLVFGFIGIGIFFYISNKRDQAVNRESLEKLNLKLQGIVVNVDEVKGYSGYGIITVRVLKTNIKNYDPRGKVDYYYCVIKDSIAEIYDHAFMRMLGDTLNINTHKRLWSWGSKWNRNNQGSIHVNHSLQYYNYIRAHTRFRMLEPEQYE